jgi:hypothetical protein
MNKRKSNRKNENNIEELKEWQEHQYDSGYYTGGKIHPSLRKPGKPKVYGVFIIAISLLFSIPLIVIVVKSISNKNTFKPENVFFFSIFVILFAGVLILQIIAGLRRINESTKKKKYKK